MVYTTAIKSPGDPDFCADLGRAMNNLYLFTGNTGNYITREERDQRYNEMFKGLNEKTGKSNYDVNVLKDRGLPSESYTQSK